MSNVQTYDYAEGGMEGPLCNGDYVKFDDYNQLESDLRAQLAAAEKRATEAEAQAACLADLHEAVRLTICWWATVRDSVVFQEGIQNSAEIVIRAMEKVKVPARAQAVAEVLAVVNDDEARNRTANGYYTVSTDWLARLNNAKAKLAALDKEK